MKKIFEKILRSVFIPVIISILFGYVSGKFMYKTYSEDVYGDLNSSRLYLVQNGEYDTYDRMREENSGNNYIYYKDNDKYKTVIGITRNYGNIDKIKSLYSDNMEVTEYYVSSKLLDSRQEEYDILLSQANDLYEVKEVVDNILGLYRSDDNIRLVSIN